MEQALGSEFKVLLGMPKPHTRMCRFKYWFLSQSQFPVDTDPRRRLQVMAQIPGFLLVPMRAGLSSRSPGTREVNQQMGDFLCLSNKIF